MKFWSILLSLFESSGMLGDMPEITRHVRDPSATGRYSRGRAQPGGIVIAIGTEAFHVATSEGAPATEAPFAVVSTPHGEQFWPAFTCTALHDGLCVGPSPPAEPTPIQPLPPRKSQENCMLYHFTNTQLISAVVVLIFLVFVAVVGFVHRRATRTRAFRNRFGSEYDRAVLEHGSSRKAEAKLADREARMDALKIRELGAANRERFVAEWQTVQSRFVDHPKAAVTEADDLIAALLEARGYPQVNFEQRAADVSVHYPRVMEDYRRAHSIAVRLGQVEATTEEQRTAMIQYRAIFDDLLQAPDSVATRTAA